MPTDSTVEDVLRLVSAFYKREGAKEDRALYLTLFNRAIDEISSNLPEGVDTDWSNDSTDSTYGRLELSGQTVTFPSDLRDFYRDSVLWDGDVLAATSIDELDQTNTDWRDSDGTPSAYARTIAGIVLDVEPSGSTDGMLKIYGRGTLPHYEEGEDTNPLAYLVLHHQLAVADYIIANLPIEYENRTDGVIKAMQDARANAYHRWMKTLPFIVHELKARARHPLGAK
jgi:hypothetical protein